MEFLGERPTLFTEIGIPFDMDDKYAYKTGDYSSQISALDANQFALEGSGAQGYTLWTYVVQVTTDTLLSLAPYIDTFLERPRMGRSMERRGPVHRFR